jgi:L-rhamnose mutarotase
MAHVGHVWRIRPGKAEEYARRHATVWPEVEALLRRLGVRTYAIYAWGDVLFSHMDVEDVERLVHEFNADPVAQRWEAEMSELIEYPNADPQTGWAEQCKEIWSL